MSPETSTGSGVSSDGYREHFLAKLPFTPDRFQSLAFDALDSGESVLVTAPTGAGKTVVADYAIGAATRRGKRAVYTTPLKALSNQKYRDLARDHGSSQVGLLTGDTSINRSAPIVVMTTEVLRNMIHSDRTSLVDPALGMLGVVVIDEVHYLEDPYRGQVWEEVIVLTPPGVPLVCLSATVSNAHEVAGWLRSVRGSCRLVMETSRPVPLRQHLLAGDRRSGAPVLMEMGRGKVPPAFSGAGFSASRSPGQGAGQRGSGRRSRWSPPDRIDSLAILEKRGFLPAIIFIFSRVRCDEALRECADAHVRLTTDDEAGAITRIATNNFSTLPRKPRIFKTAASR